MVNKKTGPKALQGSDEAKKLVCVVIEVLSGLQSPTSASELLKTSIARYYILETRAIQGMMIALEPRDRGPNGGNEIKKLLMQKKKLEIELQRSQSLVRTMHRSIGLSLINENSKPKKKNGKTIMKKRKNQVRGKRIAEGLKSQFADIIKKKASIK